MRQYDGLGYLWPGGERTSGEPRRVLWLVTLAGGHNRRVCLLTSVLDAARPSGAAAAPIYARRWCMELLFRSLE